MVIMVITHWPEPHVLCRQHSLKAHEHESWQLNLKLCWSYSTGLCALYGETQADRWWNCEFEFGKQLNIAERMLIICPVHAQWCLRTKVAQQSSMVLLKWPMRLCLRSCTHGAFWIWWILLGRKSLSSLDAVVLLLLIKKVSSSLWSKGSEAYRFMFALALMFIDIFCFLSSHLLNLCWNIHDSWFSKQDLQRLFAHLVVSVSSESGTAGPS